MIEQTAEVELPFGRELFVERQDALRARLSEAGIDAAIYVSPEEMYYLTGYNTPGYYYGFQAVVIPVDRAAFIVCRLVEESNAIARSIIEKCHVFRDTDDPARVAAQALEREGLGSARIGLDAAQVSISPAHYLTLAEAIGPQRLVSEGGILGRLRAVKSDEELDCMRCAAKVSAAGMHAAIAATAVGASEDDIAAACYSAMISAGGEYPGMPPMIASGHRAGLAHATWEGHREIKERDIVILEIPGCVRRYHACQLRCVSVGEPTALNRSRMQVALEARASALESIRAGVTSDSVDRAMRQPIEKAGLEAHHLHRAGYGLGIAYPPRWDEGQIVSLRSNDDRELEPNMVFHLLPALYFFNETLIGCTETVRVTDDGYELLTNFPTGFMEADNGGAPL
jgi:Xaa-Pro aminopeptidase